MKYKKFDLDKSLQDKTLTVSNYKFKEIILL